MKNNFKRILTFILAASMLFSFASCHRDKQENTTETVTAETLTAITETETEEPLPKFRNPLTYLACDEKVIGKRPLAVIMNNIYVALPQRGVSKMDIVYEVLAEGGILRLLGIVQDFENIGELGSMRSARPYYIEIAASHDAIFLHAGGSERAYIHIKNLAIDDIDGVKRGPFNVNGTDIFWRDQARIKKGTPIEHTMFTNGANVSLAIASKGYRTALNDQNQTAFNFKDRASALENPAGAAGKITIPHSTYVTSEFIYSEEENKYYHYQFNEPHIDETNSQQVATDNVFIIYTNQSLYPGQTDTSYRKIDVVGEGNGYYFYGGKYVPLTWKRADEKAPFKYYAADGSELKVNPGKSYVSVVDKKTENQVVISAE